MAVRGPLLAHDARKIIRVHPPAPKCAPGLSVEARQPLVVGAFDQIVEQV